MQAGSPHHNLGRLEAAPPSNWSDVVAPWVYYPKMRGLATSLEKMPMKLMSIAVLAAMIGGSALAAEKVDPAATTPGGTPAAPRPHGPQPRPGIPSKADITAGKINAPAAAHPAPAANAAAAGNAKADPATAAAAGKADAKGAGRKVAEGADVKPREKDKPADTGKGTEEKLDFIEMITGDKMYGKIHKEFPEYVILMVKEDSGRIKVPKEKIKSLNYSMDTRLKSLEEEDYAGKFKVGMWGMEKGMYQQSIALFEDIKKTENKEGVDNGEINKQLGRAYDALHQSDKALEAYNEYKQGWKEGFVDAEVAERITKLDEEVNPKVAEAAKPAAAKVVDGLEADGNWVAETWNNANPCTVTLSTDPKSGNKVIAITSVGGTKDKMAFSRYAQPLDLRESSEMVFKIFNSADAPVNLACAFVNGQGDFHESKMLKIPAKSWVSQSFKVEGKVFKSNRNDFKEWNLDLAGREHISRITFLVYGQKPFTLYLDSLFFKEAKAN